MNTRVGETKAKLDRLLIRIDRNRVRVIREVVSQIHAGVIQRSPIDTGRFVSNWVVSVGQVTTDFIEAYSPGNQGDTADGNRRAAIDQGFTAMSSYRGDRGVYITNNAPYAQELNDGSSQQAPAGFVEDSIQIAHALVSNARLLR